MSKWIWLAAVMAVGAFWSTSRQQRKPTVERALDEALADSFPSSDPPALTQPVAARVRP